MPINSNRKGKRGERELVDIYKAAGYDAYRTPNSGGLREPGDIQGVTGVHVEAKIGKSIRFWDAIDQCEGDCPAGVIPAVHFRRDRGRWRVVLPLEDFIKLLKS